jgi:hypothetical protein
LRISLAFRWSRFRLGILAARLGGGRNTVARILVDAGLQPAPERKRQPQWKAFLKAHFCEMAATDFFTVEVLTAFGIVRYWVMLVIELGSRHVHIASITHSPAAGWTEQIARHLTDPGRWVSQEHPLSDSRPRCVVQCLDRIVPLGERHLQHAITQFVAHYHLERSHQGSATVSSQVLRRRISTRGTLSIVENGSADC